LARTRAECSIGTNPQPHLAGRQAAQIGSARVRQERD
jgi:hypothetical protein